MRNNLCLSLNFGLIIFAMAASGAIQDEAEIYFSFEGSAGTTTNAAAWQNYGTKGVETAYAIGSNGSYPYPTVSSSTSIKGQAYDASGATPSANANALQYGSASTAVGSETERALYNVWSYTWCGWVKQSDSTIGLQGRLFYGASTLDLNYRGDRVEYRVAPATEGASAPTLTANLSANSISGGTNWVFLAVVYNGTIDDGSANTFVYAGDMNTSVGLIGSATNNYQRLERSASAGASFFIGNNSIAGNRPFDGYIDEVRIYGDGTQNTPVEPGYGDSALSLSQLEEIRQYDIIPEPMTIGLFGMSAGFLICIRRMSSK